MHLELFTAWSSPSCIVSTALSLSCHPSAELGSTLQSSFLHTSKIKMSASGLHPPHQSWAAPEIETTLHTQSRREVLISAYGVKQAYMGGLCVQEEMCYNWPNLVTYSPQRPKMSRSHCDWAPPRSPKDQRTQGWGDVPESKKKN